MNNISKTTLGDLIESQRGYDLPKSEMVQGIYPVRSSNGILGYHNEYKTKGPGITIGRSGTVGIPHLIKTNFYPHNTALFIKDFKGNDVNYIFYLLTNLKLNDRKTGSGVPTMNRNHLHPLEILAHLKVSSQNHIAKVLSDLDTKIEVNNKINQELEAMAKTLYDYWFVQFDFPAHLSGSLNGVEGYKSSGGKMIFNEELKREIPEGWSFDYVENLLAKEKSTKKVFLQDYKSQGKIPIIDQSSNFIAGFTDDINSIVEAKLPRIIFGDHTRILKLINFDFARGADGTQVLLSNNESVPQHLLYHSLLKIDLSNYGYARHFKFLKATKILIPNDEISQAFEEIAQGFYNKIRHNIFENQKLSELRDWLLPMLMNGQVSVGEVEQELAMVAEEKVIYKS